jgi:hypothetical protein
MPFDENAWPWPVILTRTPQRKLEQIRSIFFVYRKAFLKDELRHIRPNRPTPINPRDKNLRVVPSALSGGLGQAYISLTNTGGYSVDMSSWKLRGLANFDFCTRHGSDSGRYALCGRPLNSNGFNSRSEFPCCGEGLLAVGPLGAMNFRATDCSRSGFAIMKSSTPKPTPEKSWCRYARLRITELMYSCQGTVRDISDNLDDLRLAGAEQLRLLAH